MKKLLNILLFIAFMAAPCISLFTSCKDDNKTYAQQRSTERKQVKAFLQKGCCVMDSEENDTLLYVAPIKVITEAEFAAHDSITDIEKNEYVLFASSGVYMQIVRKGSGARLKSGESTTVLNRFVEYNIAGDSVQLSNRSLAYSHMVDEMSCSCSSGSISATFVSGLMSTIYSSNSVPEAWLYPLYYINLGRQDSPDAEIAKVRLIVPSTVGQSDAYQSVYPCFYEITYEKGR